MFRQGIALSHEKCYPKDGCSASQNSIYGLEQGELITLGVDFTIAMENAVNDNAAREFARGFYDALGAGKEITFAYDEGCRRVRLAAPNTTFSAQLLKKTS